jgi:hypothetical protein
MGMGMHGNSRSEAKATTQSSSSSTTGGNLSRALSQAGVNRTSSQPTHQQRQQQQQERLRQLRQSAVPSSAQLTHNEKKPGVRTRVPAVTSRARTTAPERKDVRQKYPR